MRSFVVVAVLCLVSMPAAAQRFPGNPEAGHAVAQRSCAQCHLIGDGEGHSAADNVPTFATLARNPSMTESRLEGFMQVPHPRMPEPALTRREIDDVASYILSLRKR